MTTSTDLDLKYLTEEQPRVDDDGRRWRASSDPRVHVIGHGFTRLDKIMTLALDRFEQGNTSAAVALMRDLAARVVKTAGDIRAWQQAEQETGGEQ